MEETVLNSSLLQPFTLSQDVLRIIAFLHKGQCCIISFRMSAAISRSLSVLSTNRFAPVRKTRRMVPV